MSYLELRSSYDSNNEFIEGSRAIYEENGAKTEVTILENRSTLNHHCYLLRLESVQVPGAGFEDGNIGDVWVHSASKTQGSYSCGNLISFEERRRLI